MDPSQLSFSSKQNAKKKRKSRTAFTNHQIFELEKRFLYQKYLSPADRDEIASHLGLTNAQVWYDYDIGYVTWLRFIFDFIGIYTNNVNIALILGYNMVSK